MMVILQKKVHRLSNPHKLRDSAQTMKLSPIIPDCDFFKM